MKRLLLTCALLALSTQHPVRAADGDFFPFAYSTDDFTNGLRLITVPTESPNLVALYLVVATGARNEVEPGKSGFAHFFEHMMFRGSERFTPEQRDAVLKRAGASVNAYTSDDRTVYHTLFAKEDLEKVFEVEADRFQRLKYSQEIYKTEALAVLGEYNKNSANPFNKLEEVLREVAFDRHTYKHTAMGFLADIQDMPNQYDYSWQFYHRYYRPEYTTMVVVGDVTREQARALTEKYFAGWKRGDHSAAIPPEPPQSGPRSKHIDWPSPTLPHLIIGFKAPAYSDEVKDKAALDLLSPIAFGENSDLYQRLVLKEQKVDVLGPGFDDQIDPQLFVVFARVKEAKDVDDVRGQILAAFRRFAESAVSQEKLDETRSHFRYGTALGLDSAEAIAGFLAPYMALRRSPDTVNKLFTLYQRITPQDIQAAAARYFTENNRTIVTLATKENR